jgi:hypothetical protein
VLQLGGANLGDVLDVACARFSRWAGGPTAAQLSKTLRERWTASTAVVLLSPERDRGQPARIAHVARLAASTPRSPE